jgi:hypothetical protein
VLANPPDVAYRRSGADLQIALTDRFEAYIFLPRFPNFLSGLQLTVGDDAVRCTHRKGETPPLKGYTVNGSRVGKERIRGYLRVGPIGH